MRTKIYFRADASFDIGYGHFVRSLALASMLKENFDCTFFTVEPNTYQISEMEQICSYMILNKATHEEVFLQSLKGDEIVVLDNYYFNTDYQKRIKDIGCFLVCIDDIHQYHFLSDIIFCPDPCKISDYSFEKYTHLYIGMKWNFLRKPFLINSNRLQHPNTIKKIVIAVGGTDPMNLTNRLLSYLVNYNLEINVIINKKDRIEKKFWSAINTHSSLSANEIVKMFKSVDMGFLSASSLAIEALALGLPIAVGKYVNNQEDLYNYLIKNSYAYPLGNFQNNIQQFISSALTQNGTLNEIDLDCSTLKQRVNKIFSNHG